MGGFVFQLKSFSYDHPDYQAVEGVRRLWYKTPAANQIGHFGWHLYDRFLKAEAAYFKKYGRVECNSNLGCTLDIPADDCAPPVELTPSELLKRLSKVQLLPCLPLKNGLGEHLGNFYIVNPEHLKRSIPKSSVDALMYLARQARECGEDIEAYYP